MVSLDRKSCRPILEMSILSMTILPMLRSKIRKRAMARVDLPAPVRPTTPTYNKKQQNPHKAIYITYILL